ncbi:SOS response-associated peptidase [Carboxylicivirga sp. A043]|uniref:SOS response-associated peptidase n=1 Tax=Carboxylicivirga litoralis TaxID=2816963 RepID=UPI0021CB35C9|nr:SOS response-associated peptidase [Carboxylicivirga sp. A043]MCU4155446.1 SOS response-associated peptidase [Carboxylicivirga sp. A043]
MCYTAKYLIEKALKRARHYGVKEDIIRYEEELKGFKDFEKVSGFTHPEIIIYTNEEPFHPILSYWGLIPHWTNSIDQANTIWNKTLNARAEIIFEKPAFKDAAQHKHCLIPVAGFYENHHLKNTTVPYYISSNDDQPLMLAGLWSEWRNPETRKLVNTCSILTTPANQLMTKIHNNPRLNEARMPLILDNTMHDEWLNSYSQESTKTFVKPFPQNKIKATRYDTKKAPQNGALPFIFDDY